MKLSPVMSWLLLIALVVLGLHLISRWDTSRASAKEPEARKAAMDEQARRDSIIRSVQTPPDFRTRCGAPASIEPGIPEQDSAGLGPDLSRSAVTYIYRLPRSEMHVVFTRDAFTPLLFREHVHDSTYAFLPYEGLKEMGCVKG